VTGLEDGAGSLRTDSGRRQVPTRRRDVGVAEPIADFVLRGARFKRTRGKFAPQIMEVQAGDMRASARGARQAVMTRLMRSPPRCQRQVPAVLAVQQPAVRAHVVLRAVGVKAEAQRGPRAARHLDAASTGP
jgi:hypothetical protein